VIIQNRKKMIPRISLGILIIICILSFAPFLDKAFHIDDPLFIWTAKQVQTHPFDFYGFKVNWNGTEMPMWMRTQNPPLASYYIALVAYWFGWREMTLHLAFLVPSLAAILGTYFLARDLCRRPMIAALASLATPVFLVSGTTLMCDTLMLSFWVWAIFFWSRGIKAKSNLSLLCASLLIAACSLTKYFGVSLVPLLLAYSLAEKRKPGYWILFLSIPLLVLAAYQWTTYTLYGRGLLLNAASYALSHREEYSHYFFSRPLIGLVFAGGLLSIFFYSPFLWRRRTAVTGAVLTLLCIALLPLLGTVGDFKISTGGGVNWPFVFQFTLMACAGVNFLAIIVADLWRNRNPDSVLLFLWSMGTLIFTCFLNWTINGRSILPLVPAFGILLMRHFDTLEESGSLTTSWPVFLPLALAFVFALWVARADYSLAETAQRAAITIRDTYKDAPGTLWFEGHWGFQYYMEQFGGKAVDVRRPALAQGDIVIIPLNNTCIYRLTRDLELIRSAQFSTAGFMTILNGDTGAGFYSDLYGPLPFAIGPDAVEEYYAYRVIK
jgi:4-amino-4-deoxy-L-arabinose transferase-like glycosyltransferase